MKKISFVLAFFISATCNGQTNITHRYECGGFNLELIANSMAKINGQFVTSQKIASLGTRGMKMEMTLMPARDGNMYGFEYVHPDGSNSRFLNVELIRTNMDQPRIIGSFDCHRISK